MLTSLVVCFVSFGAHAAERILPLTPSIAELVSALGADNEIVGVTEYTDFPATLKSKPSVGPYPRLSLETIYRLKPTLAIASRSGNAESQIEFLRKKGIPIEIITEESFSDLLTNVTTLGKRLGREQAAQALKSEWEKSRDLIIALAKTKQPSGCVAIILSDRPLIVAGQESYLTEVLNWMGAKNCFEKLKGRYPQISDEALVGLKPEWLIAFDSMGDSGDSLLSRFKKFTSTPAVQKNQLRSLKLDELLRPGPRLVIGAKRLQSVLLGM